MRPTKNSWPTSTPTLNSSSASGISACGRPIVVRPLAKPKPCSRPNAKATTQGWRIVKLVSPRHLRTISGPRKRMLSAMAALSGGSGRARVPERGDRQRDAVGDGERRDRLHQHPAVADDQQQAQHEQQVVDAEQDVLDAEAHVPERPLPRATSAAPSVTDGSTGFSRWLSRRPSAWCTRTITSVIVASRPSIASVLPAIPPVARQRPADDERRPA